VTNKEQVTRTGSVIGNDLVMVLITFFFI